ncbi:plasmid mobilization protein (plasmid) [Moraxella atlantae]|uniref:plasmid mobilization protein n=1 Tax=Faucicola atlantae TaxID=34059 RepID=UPI003753213A
MKNSLISHRLPEQVLADFNWKPAPKVKRKRPYTVAIRLSLIEKKLIEERRGSLSVADFMRASAIGQNVTQREMVRRVVPPRVDAELKRQVAYLGNNLNQLTKIAHEYHQIGNLNVVSLASELAYIRYQLDYLVNHFTAPKNENEQLIVDAIDEEFDA